MKRISSARRNRSFAGVSAATAIGVFILLLVLGLAQLFFPSALLAAELPFLRASAYLGAGIGNVAAGFENTRTLAGERTLLAAQNETLTAQNAALSAKITDLETLIGTTSNVAPGIAAGIVARPPFAPYDTFVIGAGADDGVVTGDIAYADGGIPLGVVENVSGAAAVVELLSAGGLQTPAWLGDARTPITLIGAGGGAFTAQTPRSASTTGQAVYVAGPGSLPIGIVAGEGSDPSAPLATLYIKGIVNPLSVTYVLIRASLTQSE